MADLFSAGAGGPSAPGSTPWYAIGGARGRRPTGNLGAQQIPINIARPLAPIDRPPVPSIFEMKQDLLRTYLPPDLVADIPGERRLFLIPHEWKGPGGRFEHVVWGDPGGGMFDWVDTIFEWPGLLGFATGLLLPFTFSWHLSMGIGAAIAVGGYIAPAESWFRRFSIGAGIGGAAYMGIHFGPDVSRLAGAVGDIVESALDPWGTFVSGSNQIGAWIFNAAQYAVHLGSPP